MDIKNDILQKYYTYSANGSPEISADDLLKAMEEYKQQAEEIAFKAARDTGSNAEYAFLTYNDYRAAMASVKITEADNVRLAADSILLQFLPDDETVQQLSFNFKTSAINYTANYKKDANGYWVMDNYSPV